MWLPKNVQVVFCSMIIPLAALAPACGQAPDTVLRADDYDQSCVTADDCTAVLVGDMCGCSCDYGAISASELASFMADDEAAREACSGEILTCAPCPDSPPLACESGECGFAQ